MKFLICSKCQVEMFYSPFIQTMACPKCLGHDPDDGDDNGNDYFTYGSSNGVLRDSLNDRY
jgi:hypothetical protein